MLQRFLNQVERVGNLLPNPLTLFFLLAAGVLPLSALASWLQWEAYHPLREETLYAVNLLTPEGIQRIFTEAIVNFTSFAPLGLVLVAMMGIGLAERTGLITTLLKLLVTRVPQRWVTPALVLAGSMSSIAADAGYIILPPLGALIFMGLGRHPLAGFAAVLCGVSGAFSANLFITSLDPLLSGITHEAAAFFDESYQVTPLANYFFMVVSVFILVPVAWYVTEKIVEPRLGVWKKPAGFEEMEVNNLVSAREVLGSKIAAGVFFLVLAVSAFLVIPTEGLLRGPEGSLRPFYDSLIIILAIAMFLPGLAYGMVVGTIRSDKDVAEMTGNSMATMGPYIVMAFAAAQFISYFQWSNLGFILSMQGAAFLQWLGLQQIPLLLGIIFLVAILNLLIGSASAKWAMMSVILIPMMMSLGFSPELTQAAYRVGDSITNLITPVSPYFPVLLAFASKYQPGMKIGSFISLMLPYSLAFAVAWTLLLLLWAGLGLPLGPDAAITYP